MKRIYLVMMIIMCAVLALCGHGTVARAADKHIVSVTAENITVEEGIGYDYNGTFMYYIDSPSFTVTYDDGTEETNDYSYFYDLGYGMFPENPQTEQNPFEVGHTYPITLSVYEYDAATESFYDTGVSCTYNVSIVANPVESVSVQNLEFTEYLDAQVWYDDSMGNVVSYPIESAVVTVKYKDGQEYSGNLAYYSEQGLEVPGIYVDGAGQDPSQPLTVGTHTLTASYHGVSGSGTLTINAFPVTSIALETDPLVLHEGEDGYYTDDPDTGENYFYYSYSEEPRLVLTKTDGTLFTGTPTEIFNEFGLAPSVDFPPQSSGSQLIVGNSYAISLVFGPISGTGTVQIEAGSISPASPVQSVSVSDLTMIELLDASLADDGNGNTYPYYYVNPELTVTCTDGSMYNGDLQSIFNQTGYQPDVLVNNAPQGPNNILSFGTHTLTVSVGGVQGTGSLTIEPCPYTAISAGDIVLTQDVDGYQEYDETGNTFFRYTVPSTVNLTLENTDGSSETKTIDEWVSELQRSITIEIPGQSSTNELSAGDTCVANISLGALTGTCNVAIQADPNSVQEISIQDLTFTELIDASLENDGNGGFYPYYNLDPYITISVTFTDGNSFTGTPFEFADQFGIYPSILINDNTQSPDYQLSSGSYTMSMTYKGVTGTGSLTIGPCPFTAISAAPVTVATTNVYASIISDDYIGFAINQPDLLSVTLTKADGTTISGTPTELCSQLNLTQFFSIELYQPNNGSQMISPGTYQATIRLGALSNTFDLTIENNAIQEISIDDIIWTQNQTGNWDTFTNASGEQVQYWKYPSYYDCLGMTVHYQDGSNWGFVLSSLEDQLGEKASFDFSQGPGETIAPGNYTVHMTIAGMTAEFHITVYASIQSFTIDDYALTQYFDARWVSLEDGTEFIHYPIVPPSMRVTLSDGTEIFGSMYELQMKYGWGVEIIDNQSFSDPSSQWEPGAHVCSFSGMGFQGTFTVTLEATSEVHKFTRKVHEDEYILYPATCSTVAYYLYGCEYHDGEISTCPGKYYYLYDTPDMEHYSDYFDPDAHIWSDWEVIIPATETAEGLKRRHCVIHLDAYEEAVIPSGNTPVNGYNIIEGGDETYYKLTSDEQNNLSDLTIVSDAPMGRYLGFFVDGQLIEPYYIASVISGSTRVTLTPAFLRHLEMGTHFVTIMSSDGSCTTTMTLATRPAASQTDDNNSQPTEDSDSSESSSQTDDNSSESSQTSESSTETSSEPEKEESSSTPTESSSQESSGNSAESSSMPTESESSKEESSTTPEQSKDSESSQNSSSTSGGETSGGSSSSGSGSAATGDNTNIVAYIMLLLSALVTLMVVIKKKKELN